MYKTSKEWLEEYPHIKLLDPDGWDRKNFYYSFNVEKITKQEFINRLNQSSFSTTTNTVK